jgi:hypothetical protein
LSERELLEEAVAYRIEIRHRDDVLGRRRRRPALQLDPGPARDVPESKLVDQLRLIEAIAFAVGGEVGQPVDRQSRLRALPSLPLDRLDRPPSRRLRHPDPW